MLLSSISSISRVYFSLMANFISYMGLLVIFYITCNLDDTNKIIIKNTELNMEIETSNQDLAPAQLDLALKSVWARCLSAVRTTMICSLSLWTSMRAKQTRLSAPRSESRAKSEKFLTFYRICIFIPRLFEYLYFKRFLL